VAEIVVATAHDCALPTFWHDEGERGLRDFAVMNRNLILRRHVGEHAPEPVVGH
jgi:hypothetical protein